MNLGRIALFFAALSSATLHAQTAEPVPTTIESDGNGIMVSTDTETTITFEKNVRVTGTNIRLTCDYLQVIVLRKGDTAGALGKVDKFRSLLARGNVRIIQGDREAACGRAEVKPEEDKIVLSEKPVVVFHSAGGPDGGRMEGETITMFRGNRTVEVTKPSTTLSPLKDLGFDESKLLNPDKPADGTPAAPKKQP